MRAPIPALLAVSVSAVLLAGCEESQSVLAPGGAESERVYVLWSVLFWGGTAILVAVVVLSAVAIFGGERWRRILSGERIVKYLGIGFPVVTLAALLVYGLLVMRANDASAKGDPLRIEVIGEQWWWRVVYRDADGSRFEAANEIRIPTDRRVEVALTTADVIHSFWVPVLAGKVDMIPGRTNTITLIATKAGIYRGQCTEYCGGAHALMAFHVVALEPGAFEEWFAQEAAVARDPSGPNDREGQRVFMTNGCGGCHTVRGTAADGVIGPDLTHVGGRHSIGAATLDNSPEAIAAWIEGNQHIKPENRMPPYRFFTDEELAALAEYLAGLR